MQIILVIYLNNKELVMLIVEVKTYSEESKSSRHLAKGPNA